MIRRMTIIFALLVLVLPSQLLEAESNSSPLGHPAYRGESVLTGTVSAHSRDTTWEPESGIVMEVGGMDFLADGRLAISTRMGEGWLLSNVLAEDLSKVEYHRFASGLHEPLGLLVEGDSLLVAQRAELTRLNDRDGDSIADEYLCEAQGWNVSGAYHGYAYGPERDGQGRLWVTLNLDMGDRTNNDGLWRGWGLVVNSQGELKPMAAGMRSPSGLGVNREGDMFYTDNQGPWNGTCALKHLPEGKFVGHPGGFEWYKLAEPFIGPRPEEPTSGSRFMTEAKRLPHYEPPAVLFPYNKMGKSAAGIACDTTDGEFGPFKNQMFVTDQSYSTVMRCYLEKVQGHYQGVCFPFLEGFNSGSLGLELTPNGKLFVGGTNRGWGSRGRKPFAIDRVDWTGKVPFEIHEMRAKPDGFELTFTEAVDSITVEDTASYNISTYTYIYQSAYGSPEVDHTEPKITKAVAGDDGKSVRLFIDGLQEGHVHELHSYGVSSVNST